MAPNRLPRIAYDPATLEEFYREHIGAVERFVVRRVGDPGLAADLPAEVFLAAVDAAPNYEPERAAPVAWLYGVARNVVAAEFRRSVRERRANARIEGRRLLDEDDVERMQERIDAAGRARELFEALAHIPEGERAVLELVAPAFAVDRKADGDVSVTINNLSDAHGLQSQLRAAGINAEVDYTPAGKACREPRGRAAASPSSGAGVVGVRVSGSSSSSSTFT